MDSITHGLVGIFLFHGPFPGLLLLFAVLGAILPDSDILHRRFSDRDPRLFVFSHGGFTHSIPGAAAVAGGVAAGFQAWQIVAGQGYAGTQVLALGWALAFAGALTHLALDALAFPGIPLLYPARTRKYSAGIFPGPSLVLFGTSVCVLLALLSGHAGIGTLPVYMGFIAVFIVAHAVLRAVVTSRHPGLAIPTLNPLKWLVVRESEDFFEVYSAGPSKMDRKLASFPRHDGVGPGYIGRHIGDPEVQRVVYHSYLTVAGREDGSVVIRDPLRECGLLPYPPHYRRVCIPAGDGVDF